MANESFFRVEGANLETGEETFLLISAPSSQVAEAVARGKGLVIASVREATDDDRSQGLQVIESKPPAPPKRIDRPSPIAPRSARPHQRKPPAGQTAPTTNTPAPPTKPERPIAAPPVIAEKKPAASSPPTAVVPLSKAINDVPQIAAPVVKPAKDPAPSPPRPVADTPAAKLEAAFSSVPIESQAVPSPVIPMVLEDKPLTVNEPPPEPEFAAEVARLSAPVAASTPTATPTGDGEPHVAQPSSGRIAALVAGHLKSDSAIHKALSESVEKPKPQRPAPVAAVVAALQLPQKAAPAPAAVPASAARPSGGGSWLAVVLLAPLAFLSLLGGVGVLVYTLGRVEPADLSEIQRVDYHLQALTQSFLGGMLVLAGLLLFVAAGLVYVGSAFRSRAVAPLS